MSHLCLFRFSNASPVQVERALLSETALSFLNILRTKSAPQSNLGN